MHYPQKCLVNTRFCEYLNFNKTPNGENLIVAIATYMGYNMEDGIIMNKTSVERGMFNLTYFKNHVEKEEANLKDNELITFMNPSSMSMSEIKWANYSNLDENGFPKLNTYLKEGDAIIGKAKVKSEMIEDPTMENNLFGTKIKKDIYYDRSVIADKTVSGTVDRVFMYFDEDNMKTCKIRFRKTRQPELGDKCCCYDEETQVLTNNGWKFFQDLTLKDKVASMVEDALVYQHPLEIQCFDFEGKLYEIDNAQVNLRVTDNHRMYCRTSDSSDFTIKEAKDIYGTPVYYKKNVDKWEPDLLNAPSELLIHKNKIVGFIH